MVGAARHSQALCAAEVKVAGRTIKERGFDSLFQQVDGLSDVDIIALFAPAALGLAAYCTDAWLSPEQFKLLHLSSWRLRRFIGPGQWICGRCWQECTEIRSVCALVPDVWSGEATFGYI